MCEFVDKPAVVSILGWGVGKRHLTNFQPSQYLTRGNFIVESHAQIEMCMAFTKNTRFSRHSSFAALQAPTNKFYPSKQILPGGEAPQEPRQYQLLCPAKYPASRCGENCLRISGCLFYSSAGGGENRLQKILGARFNKKRIFFLFVCLFSYFNRIHPRILPVQRLVLFTF